MNTPNLDPNAPAARPVEDTLLRKIIDQTYDGIEVVEPETGRLLDVNESLCASHGYTRQELLSMRVSDINISLASAALWKKNVEYVFQVGSATFEDIHRRKDGSTFPVEVTVRHVRLERDYFLAVVRDITDRKNTQRQLRESEERFRTLLETVGDWLWEIDEHGVYTYASPRVRDLLGYEPEEVLGKTPFDFMPEAEAKRVAAIFQSIAAEQKPFHLLENTNRHKDGHLVVLETNGMPVFDKTGVFRGYRGIDRDVTERKRILTEHQRSEELVRKLSRAVDQSPVSIFITDTAGRIEYVNRKFCEVTGYSAAETLGQTPRLLKSGQQSPEFYARLWQTILRGYTWAGEIQNRKKNGDPVWEMVAISPILNGDSQVTHFVAVKEDITERKRNEEQLQQQAEVLRRVPDAVLVVDLADKVQFWSQGAETLYGWTSAESLGRERSQLLCHDDTKYAAAKQAVLENGEWTGELPVRTRTHAELLIQCRWTLIRDAQGKPKSILSIGTDVTEQKRLEAQLLRAQRMESLGVLAGGVAHDLNNVLTPILISVPILKEGLASEEKLKILDLLQANVVRGANLIRQLLAFGRGIKGERAPVKLAHLAREIEQIIHETFPKSIRFELSTAADLWPVLGDATQIHQVLMNLCVNARDAMPNGGVLSIRIENKVVDKPFVRRNPDGKIGQFVLLTVADTGTGMSREVQEKMFDPFFTTKPPGEGTGLGLSTTLGIIHSHGGFIGCESEIGRGSVFQVYLPALVTTRTTPLTASRDTPMFHGRNEQILLVDDEESIREVGKRTLEFFGYRVLLAQNGAEAAALYQEHRQDIAAVITDIAMPVMDGTALIKELQAMHSGVKIIVCSGHLGNNQVMRATESGIQCFIAKPYGTEELLRALENLLNTKV